MKKPDNTKDYSLWRSLSASFFGGNHRRGASALALLIFTAALISISIAFVSFRFSPADDSGSRRNLFSRTSAVVLKTLGGIFMPQEKKPVFEIALGENSDADKKTSSENNSGLPVSSGKIPGQHPKNSATAGNEKNKSSKNSSTSLPQTENQIAVSPFSETQDVEKIRDCNFSKTGNPHHQIIFSEINWSGSKESANDEWIEIKNNSGNVIALDGWQILSGDGNIKIIFENGNKISAGGFYLLERTDDGSAAGVAADEIYSGALSNSGVHIKIFDAGCNLSDEIDASKKWPAGDSASRKTMERSVIDLSWHTGASESGTPKKENTAAFSKKEPEIISSQQDGTQNGAPANPPVENQTANSSNPQNQNGTRILIAEVQITGGSGKTTNDFVKIYNPSTAVFNLKGHRLVKRTKTGTSDISLKSWISDAFIPAGGYYAWANSSFISLSPAPDTTTSGSIADDNGVAVRQGSENIGIIIDAVAWGAAQNGFLENGAYPTNPAANQILARKSVNGVMQDTDNNQNDFEIK